MREIEQLLDKITCYVEQDELDIVKKAIHFAEKSHEARDRIDGSPYILHPIAVANILVDWYAPPKIIAAALLHDTLKPWYSNCPSLDALEENFSHEIAMLVKGVTDLGRFGPRLSRSLSVTPIDENAEEFVIGDRLPWTWAMLQRNPIAVVIKIADRLHNIASLHALSQERQLQFATAVLNIFAPLSDRLGMSCAKQQLQDACLQIFDPARYASIETLRQSCLAEFRLLNLATEFQQALAERSIIARTETWITHLYGMHRQQLEAPDKKLSLSDVFALIVITQSPIDCYHALGVIHNQWRPLNDIQDYIGQPRRNGYRAVHSRVSDPFIGNFRVIICTEEMHLVNDYGITAQWRKVDEQLLPQIEPLPAPPPEHIMVLTPKGDIKYLPKGATPIDFAYAIHEEVGHRCMYAWVNRKKVPLNSVLQDGDLVEIIVSRSVTPGPNPEWIKSVVSENAKRYINQWTRRNKQNVEFVIEGRDRIGLVADVSSIISQAFNMMYFHADALQDGKALIRVGLADINSTEIEQLVTELKAIAHIIRVQLEEPKPPPQAHHRSIISYQTGTGNPYTIGKPVYGRNFKGREREQTEIIHRLRGLSHYNTLLIWGQRRIGKTSLLQHLERNVLATNQECLPVYITIEDVSHQPIGHFLHRIADTIEQKVQHDHLKAPTPAKFRRNPIYYFRRFIDQIEQILEPLSFLVIIDEFQGIGNLIEEGATREAVFACFRSLAQHGTSINFLFSGGGVQSRLLAQSGLSLLLSVIDYIQIDCLERADAQTLITDLDPSLTYTEQAVNKILEMTRCHPCYIQYLCRELYEKLDDSREIDLVNVEEVLRQTMKGPEKLINLVEHFWTMDVLSKDSHIYNQNKLVLSAIAEGVDLSAWMPFDKIAQSTYPFIMDRELVKVLDYLSSYGSLDIDGSKYRIRIPLFAMWLRETCSFENLCKAMRN